MDSFWKIFLAVHAIVAMVNLHDLFKRSRRNNKLLWALTIVALPLFGAVIYDQTKQRKKHLG